jgi:hypothetical protein
MRYVAIISAWLTGAYFGYTLRPPKVTERYIKVICIPDSDTEAKPGDSLELNVEDWIEFNNIITEQIKYEQE